jgi:hypothetical protein
VVAAYLFAIFSTFGFLARQQKLALGSVTLLAGTAMGFAFQVLFFVAAPGSNAVTRGPWDSNTYGGRLVDFLVASPALNTMFPSLENLKAGASVELSQVGLLGAALGLLSIIAFLVVILRNGSRDSRAWLLSVLAVASTLMFLSGGFGNLQAGLLLSVGIDSPARVWARVIILLAVIGAGFLLLAIERFANFSGYAGGVDAEPIRSWLVHRLVLPLMIIAIAAPDFITSRDPKDAIVFSELEEFAAVEFLSTQGADVCPVLQLPIESIPLPLNPVSEHWSDTYYRGLVPFLMEPNISWSFGDYLRANRADYLDDLGPQLTSPHVSSIQRTGFCFILFDKKLSAISREYSLDLPGTSLEGLFLAPSFSSERFDVYSLPPDSTRNPQELKLGEPINFYSNANGTQFAYGSLWIPEESHTWASEGDVTISFRIDKVPKRGVIAEFSAWSYLPPGQLSNGVTVSVGGVLIDKILIGPNLETYKFTIPSELLKSELVNLKFSFDHSTRPCDVSNNLDCRSLSIAFQRILLR